MMSDVHSSSIIAVPNLPDLGNFQFNDLDNLKVQQLHISFFGQSIGDDEVQFRNQRLSSSTNVQA